MRKYNASMGQMTELQTVGTHKNKDQEEAYKIKKKTFDLLPNADENIVKLKVSVETATLLPNCYCAGAD